MAPRVKRRTPQSDANGNVLEDFRGLYEVQALAAARKAGVPGVLLDPAGWNGDPNDPDDLTGFFAEQIYRLGEVNWTAPDAIEQLADAIDVMQRICRNLGVDPKAAIPYDLARFKRRLHEARERRAAIARGDDLPLDPEAFDASEAWGIPSGQEHEDHANGKTPEGWRCLAS